MTSVQYCKVVVDGAARSAVLHVQRQSVEASAVARPSPAAQAEAVSAQMSARAQYQRLLRPNAWLHSPPYYCYLAMHLIGQKKRDTIIGFCTDPVYAVYAHNHGMSGSREARLAAPYWKLAAVAGPLASPSECRDYCAEWSAKTRGIVSKLTKGRRVASERGIPYYTSTVHLTREEIKRLFEGAGWSQLASVYELMLSALDALSTSDTQAEDEPGEDNDDGDEASSLGLDWLPRRPAVDVDPIPIVQQ